jgi:hypothetical protein
MSKERREKEEANKATIIKVSSCHIRRERGEEERRRRRKRNT